MSDVNLPESKVYSETFHVLEREYEVEVFVSLQGFLYADEIPNSK